jgi:hypothetical protein
LNVTNVSPSPRAAGNAFHLFAATKYTGAFAAVNPQRPGPGLQWDTSSLVQNGTLSVTAVPAAGIVSFTLSGLDLVINASNGVAGAQCSILMSTNLALPVAQWTPISTTRLSSNGNFIVIATNSVDATAQQRFYGLEMQ